MSLPPDDVLGAAFHEADDAEPDLGAMVLAVIPAADALTQALAQIRLVDLERTTPEQRGELVALRQTLDASVRDAASIRDAIDHAFRAAASLSGARQITAGERGIVRIEPKGDWKVDVPAMASALEELVAAGKITQGEMEVTFTTKTVVSADNRKLNYMAANRGAEVQQAIDAHRTYVIDPMSAKLTYGKVDR